MSGDRTIRVMAVCLLTLVTAALRQTTAALLLLALAVVLTAIWAPIPPAVRGYWRHARRAGHWRRLRALMPTPGATNSAAATQGATSRPAK